MYGFICKEKGSEWWVRRKKAGKSDVIITEETKNWFKEYDLGYVLRDYCICPREVKKTARKLLGRIEKEG